jgi:superfamily I DNA/RNA helicase
LSIIREYHNELGLLRSFSICNERKRLQIAEQVLRDVEQPDGGGVDDAGELLRDISMAKTVGSDVDELRSSTNPFEAFIGNALAAYNEALHAGGQFIDLDDMIELPVLLLERNLAIRRR